MEVMEVRQRAGRRSVRSQDPNERRNQLGDHHGADLGGVMRELCIFLALLVVACWCIDRSLLLFRGE
jgi:hypothetical protein